MSLAHIKKYFWWQIHFNVSFWLNYHWVITLINVTRPRKSPYSKSHVRRFFFIDWVRCDYLMAVTRSTWLLRGRYGCHRVYGQLFFAKIALHGSYRTDLCEGVTVAVFTWARITFRKTFQNVIRPFPDFSPCEHKAVWNQAFETRFETRKKGVLDRDPPRKPDSRTCERKALSERDSCVCILKMHAAAMHKRMGQLACADCAVGAKYYLAVSRSWSWLGRHLQCMWTHVVQFMIPITLWIAIQNVFRNVILAHVNTAIDISSHI